MFAMSEVVETTVEAKVVKPQRRGGIAPRDSKLSANYQSNGGPGMFDSKPNAAGKPVKMLSPVSSFQPASPTIAPYPVLFLAN